MSLDSDLGSSDCLELKQNVAPLLGYLVADVGSGVEGSTQEGTWLAVESGHGWSSSPNTIEAQVTLPGHQVSNQMPAMVVGFWLLNSLRRPNRKTFPDSLL